jgi:hypothetical protein
LVIKELEEDAEDGSHKGQGVVCIKKQGFDP